MSILAWGLALLLCIALGRPWLGALSGAEDSATYRVALSVAAGSVVIHVILTALQLVGVRWSLGTLLLGAFACLAATWFMPRPASSRSMQRPGWGEGVAAACLLVFAFYSWRLWIIFSDFIYHWGIKAQKFQLAGGVDFDYLITRAIRPTTPPWFQNSMS